MTGNRAIALTGLLPPFRGGIAHYTIHLGEALARRHRTRVFGYHRQYPESIFPGRTQIDASPMKLTVSGVRTLDPVRPWTWVSTVEQMRRFGATTVVHQWWHPWFAPATWSLLRMLAASGIEITAICHNLEPHESIPESVRIARRSLSPADRIIVHGQPDAKRARELWPHARVEAHPHPPYESLSGQDIDRTRAREALGEPATGPLVVFFGCVKPYKGLDDLIEAMPDVIRTHPGCRLLVAGEFYSPRSATETRIRALELTASVTLDDRYVPNDEVGLIMRAADAVVLPYRSATGSGVLPIALSAGTPVVTTAVGNLPGSMRDGRDGRIVPPSDPRALAGAICSVLDDPPDASAIVRAATSNTWDGLATAILQ